MLGFLGGIPLKYVLGGAGVLALLFVIWLGFNHYTHVVDENSRLHTENAMLVTANTSFEEVISQYREREGAVISLLAEREANREAAREEGDRVNDLFSQHDLSLLALRRPGLVERRIDLGTSRIFGMLEAATDSLRSGGRLRTERNPGSAAP